MKHGWLVALAAIAGVAAVAIILWLASAPAAPVPRRSQAAAERPAAASSPALPAPESSRIEVPPPAEASAGSGPARGDRRAAGGALEGTLFVWDAGGAEHQIEDGQISLLIVDEAGGHVVPAVPVVRGRWHLAIEQPASEIAVQEIVLGGRPAIMPQPRFPVPPSGWIDLRAFWPGAVLVHVIDEERKTELDRVTLAIGDAGSDERLGPGKLEERDVLARGDSPVRLEGNARMPYRDILKLTVWVTAADHVGRRTTLDLAHGSEVTIALPRATALEVTLQNLPPRGWPPVQLTVCERVSREEMERGIAELIERLRTATSGHGGEAPFDGSALRDELLGSALAGMGETVRSVEASRSGVTRIDDLIPGPRVVAALMGSDAPPVLLGRADVDLVVGETSHVTLDLVAPPPLVETVPLAGTLSIPIAWHDVNPTLHVGFRRRESGISQDEQSSINVTPTPLPGMPGMYAWDAGRVTPGGYDLRIAWPRFAFEIDVGTEGNRHVELRLPRPAQLHVRTVDAESGVDVTLRDLSWQCDHKAGLHGWGDVPIFRDSGEHDAAHEQGPFQIPQGRVSITASFELYEDASATLDAVPGRNEITLRAVRASGVILEASSAGQPIDWPVGYDRIAIAPVDGPGRLMLTSSNGRWIRFRVSAPGVYRITFPDLAGRAAVPPLDVEIPSGEMVRRVIALEPAR